MKASDVAAWWGAGVATLVFAWDIYKWRTSGPKLAMKVLPNMQELGDPKKTKLISVEVANRGDRPTTLTHLGFYGYRSLLRRLLRRREATCGLVPIPGGGPGLPFHLAPGSRWSGLAEQDAVAANHQEPYVYAVIFHSGSSREALCRVKLTR
jgi:hypothetical protein